MGLIEIRNGEPVINLSALENIMCKCGHSVMNHYFAEGCCDRSGCGCPKFEQVGTNHFTKEEQK